MRKIFMLLLVVGLPLLFKAIGSEERAESARPVSINRLLSQPAGFDGKGVAVVGEVMHGFGVMGYGGFLLRQHDQAAEVLILSDRGVPPAGSKVFVTGRFHQAFTLNNRQFPVIVRGDQ